MNHTRLQTELISLCRNAFKAYDEVWIVGPKGDHHKNLVDLEVLEERQISLFHVHNPLGNLPPHAKVIRPPIGSSRSFDTIFSEIDISITKEINRVIAQDKQVCILAPFPNAMLNKIIHEKDEASRFTIAAPVEDDTVYTRLESKLQLQKLIESADLELASRILIPSINISPSDSFEKIRQRLSLYKDEAIYLQRDVSGGGEGTARIRSQEEFTSLLASSGWKDDAKQGLLKASVEVSDAYPANGSGCIVPLRDGECEVYIDPLSYKPTGIETIGMKENSGIGNDWSSIWSKEVQEQYIQATTLIGKELYKTWGYTGIFGPDYLVEEINGEYRLRITEVNPRWQGTTPYQTYNALIAARLPLELVHYVLKLDKDNKYLKQLLDLLGNVDSYNHSSVDAKGCFYIKIGAPKDLRQVTNDMNGSWLFDGETLYNKSSFTYKHLISQSTPTSLPIIIKAPPAGSTVGGEFAAIGYIIGRSEVPIFSTVKPQVSDYGQKLFDAVRQSFYSGVK